MFPWGKPFRNQQNPPGIPRHAFLLSSPAASWHCYQVLAVELSATDAARKKGEWPPKLESFLNPVASDAALRKRGLQ